MANKHEFTVSDDWIGSARTLANLAAELERHEITGDAAYLASRSKIDPTILPTLDALRFQYSSGSLERSADDGLALEDFRGAPPEVLAVPVSKLRLGTRAKNRLAARGLKTIGAVVEFGTSRISSIAGAGRKVLDELHLSFKHVTETYLASRTTSDPPMKLSQAIKRWLESMNHRTREIIDARLGLSAPPQTLEALGAKLGVTRERVRQVEAKAVRDALAEEEWPQALREKLLRLLNETREPLWLVALPYFDLFFEDFEYGERALGRVIDMFAADMVHCFSVNGAMLLSRITEDEWQEIRSAVMDVARDCVKRRSSHTEFLVAVESLSMSRNARELGELLADSARPYIHMARQPGSIEPVLVAFGRGVDHVVRAVVEEAEVPLHYSEIHRRVQRRSEDEVEVRRVHSSLHNDDFYLLARGTYGLWRHLEITEAIASQIVEAAEEVVDRADRQWHAGEILAALRLENPKLVLDLDLYGINAVMTRSKDLRYLGRMVWVAASSGEKDSSDRIDIAQACTRFLREAGRPLSRTEILEKLRDWRGIGKHFQIHVSDEIVPVAPGVFGLRSRDLPVSVDEIKQMLICLGSALERRGSGLHASELAPVFTGCELGFASKVNQSTFYAFAARDDQLQVDSAGYIGLATWEGTRRLSVLAAGRQLAEKAVSPISVDDFLSLLSSLVGRPLNRMDATFTLRDSGYIYDQYSKMWLLPADEQVDVSIIVNPSQNE